MRTIILIVFAICMAGTVQAQDKYHNNKYNDTILVKVGGDAMYMYQNKFLLGTDIPPPNSSAPVLKLFLHNYSMDILKLKTKNNKLKEEIKRLKTKMKYH